MAENTSSCINSLSDSEISFLVSEKSSGESVRARNHSEKNFAFLKPQLLKLPRNRKISDVISDIDNKSFQDVISDLKGFSIPSKEGIKCLDYEVKSSDSDGSPSTQLSKTNEKEIESVNVLQDKQNVSEDSECGDVVLTTSVGDLELQEVVTGERINLQNDLDVISKTKMATNGKIDHENSETRNVITKISSPYDVLERADLNMTPVENDFLGEPRCLAIKKYAADEDEDFDLDLVMTADIDDEDYLLMEKKAETTKKTKNPHPDPNDMFLDDDDSEDVTEVKNVQYVNLASPSKNGKNYDSSKLEKEEGELTPDQYRSNSNVANSKTTSSKKTRATESNLEFLNKVNRCFRKLEREFSNMHVPQESKRLVGHLQDLVCVVERVKRKLTVLVDSATSRRNISHSKSKANEESRSSKEKDHKSGEHLYESVRDENSEQNNNPDYKGFDDMQTKQLNKYLEERRKKYYEKKAENYLSQNVLAPQPKLDEVLSKKEHFRRTHSGSKIERQRIRSLFKRQMNLITQQIIQQSDQDKHQTSKKISSNKTANQQRPNLGSLASLDDMECFLELLKAKKGQKVTTEDIIRDIRKKKLLKFTTKKKSPSPKTRALPVLLAAPKEDEIIIDSNVNTAKPITKELPAKEKENSEKSFQQNEKLTKEIVKPQSEQESDDIQNELTRKNNSTHSLNAKQSSKSGLSKLKISKKQKDGKNMTKRRQIDNESKEPTPNGIEFCGGENVPSSSKEVIDSSLLKRNSKETKRDESLFHSKASDFEKDSWVIFPENSKNRIRKKFSEPKSSESDSDSQRDQILKKRKRNESGGDSCRKLSSSDSKRDLVSGRKSRTRYRSDGEAVIDGTSKKLPEELLAKKLFIVRDNDLEILDNYFCVKVKDNQIYLKKARKSRKTRHGKSREQRSSQIKEEVGDKRSQGLKKEMDDPAFDSQDAGATLQEMEDFLEQLRSKKASSEKQHDTPLQSQQIREMKFMARIQAKRKAKLMACVSTTPNISEKEAKFLKDLENRSKNPDDSPETESKKQKLLEKIRAETDFIVLSQKQAAALEDDPLSDVKTFLNMIKEAESTNDENSKQFYVSFSMKRSDVKQLENITTGKASALSEESQKLLNSVRAKMRAKKTPAILENEEPQKVA